MGVLYINKRKSTIGERDAIYINVWLIAGSVGMAVSVWAGDRI